MHEDEFYTRVSHDLRAPLGAMFMWLDVLRSGKRVQRDAAIAALYEAARAQAAVIDELLDVACARGCTSAGGDSAAPDVDLRGTSALVVDDDELLRDGLSLLLEDRGVAVEAAASATEALAILRGACPDVLLCDVTMPGEDGMWLVRQLRAGDGPARDLPAVALTARTREADRVAALAAGFQIVLTKPVEPDVLFGVVARLVAGRQAEPRPRGGGAL